MRGRRGRRKEERRKTREEEKRKRRKKKKRVIEIIRKLTPRPQTRLDIEAEHIRRFRWNFHGWRDVTFPSIYLATRSVLIEAYEPGQLVSKFTLERTLRVPTSQAAPLSKKLSHFVVSRGEDIYLKMLLVDNLMHADLHPGNILLQMDPPNLALIDLGMVARLTTKESEAFVGLLNAIGAGDGAAAARCVLDFSAEQTSADIVGFEESMSAYFCSSCRGFGKNVLLGEVLRGVLLRVRRFRVAVDANYMTLVTNALCLEGMAAALLPSYNVMDAAQPLLEAHRRLPRVLFRASLPLAAGWKRLQDTLTLRSTRDEMKESRASPSARARPICDV